MKHYTSGGGAGYSVLYNCTIANNSATLPGNCYGGGADSATLYNCLVVSNYCQNSGSGAAFSYLYNCTVVGNWGASGLRDGKCCNCIIYYNSPNNYSSATSCKFTNSCTYPTSSIWQVTDRNITNEPSFVNTNAGNYRLSQGSPCINSGNNQYAPAPPDLDGHSRIDRYSGIVDMGCYEYLPAGMISRIGF